MDMKALRERIELDGFVAWAELRHTQFSAKATGAFVSDIGLDVARTNG